MAARFVRPLFGLVIGIVIATLGEIGVPSLRAATPDAATAAKIVDDSAARYAEHFANRDAAALAALFTPEAEYVDADGTVFHGRTAIAAEFAAAFETAPVGKLEIEIVSIRPIAEGLLVEEGVSTFHPEADGPKSQSRYVALHARQADDAWLLAGVRVLNEHATSAHEQLKAMIWLLGRWREEGEDGVTETHWKWSDDGMWLLAEFTTKDLEGRTHRGTHRLGWDAERQQYRSWIFDSTGGFADGWWTADDNGWSVRLVGLDGRGVRIGTTATYALEGPERFTITLTQRTRGGESLPPVAKQMVRKPPEPSKPAAK